jgi:DNA-binding response OmpR family regulator
MAKKSILLVIDDEKSIADGIKMMLESADFSCVVAYSGEEGLIKAKEHTPDLVLLDINMPHPDGFHVLQTLKMDTATAKAPVIMVTSCDGPEDIEKATKLGAVDYVLKPINFDNLRNSIAKALSVR